eukprot:10057_1
MLHFLQFIVCITIGLISMAINKHNHAKIMDLFHNYTNPITYTTNGNTETQCTSDCQTFMHISTDISSKISGVITPNAAHRKLHVGCHHDVVEENIITYGELEVTEDGVNAGLVWNCLYNYLWKESFQDPLNISPSYDPRNVHAFSILLRSDNYTNDEFIEKDMMLFNERWKFDRNTRLNYFALLHIEPIRENTPFGRQGHMVIYYDVYKYPLLFDPQKKKYFGNLMTLLKVNNVFDNTKAIHLFVFKNNIYLRSKIMALEAYQIRCNNIMGLYDIFNKYHPTQLLYDFLNEDFPTNLILYYVAVAGEDDANDADPSPTNKYNICQQQVSEWVQYNQPFNYDDPKVNKIKCILEIIHSNINTDSKYTIQTQILLLCNGMESAMDQQPLSNLSDSTYMVKKCVYNSEHIARRAKLITIAKNSNETARFISDVNFTSQMCLQLGVKNQKIFKCMINWIINNIFVVWCSFSQKWKLFCDKTRKDTSFLICCELNMVFSAASGFLAQSHDMGDNNYFLSNAYANNETDKGVAAYKQRETFNHYLSQDVLNKKLIYIARCITDVQTPESILEHFKFGSEPEKEILLLFDPNRNDNQNNGFPIPAGTFSQLQRNIALNQMDKDFQYMLQFNENDNNNNYIDFMNHELYLQIEHGFEGDGNNNGNHNTNDNGSDNGNYNGNNNGNNIGNDNQNNNMHDNGQDNIDDNSEKDLRIFTKNIIDPIKYNCAYQPWVKIYVDLMIIYRNIQIQQAFKGLDIWKSKYEAIVINKVNEATTLWNNVMINSNQFIATLTPHLNIQQQCDKILVAIQNCLDNGLFGYLEKINVLVLGCQLISVGHIPYINSKISQLVGNNRPKKKRVERCMFFIDRIVENEFPASLFWNNDCKTIASTWNDSYEPFIEFVLDNLAKIDSIATNDIKPPFHILTNTQNQKWLLFSNYCHLPQ